jgi:alkaline phosphatase
MRGGKPGESLLPAEPAANAPAAKPNVRVDDSHTGEQVLVAAQGPGAEKVHGFIRNTDLFDIMMSAYGWAGTAP